MTRMPRPLCPRCGQDLRGASGGACPGCGYFIDPAMKQHRAAVRYWRFLRLHRQLDILMVVLWLVAVGLAYWVISLSPGKGLTALTVAAGVGVVGLGHYLQYRRGRKQG